MCRIKRVFSKCLVKTTASWIKDRKYKKAWTSLLQRWRSGDTRETRENTCECNHCICVLYRILCFRPDTNPPTRKYNSFCIPYHVSLFCLLGDLSPSIRGQGMVTVKDLSSSITVLLNGIKEQLWWPMITSWINLILQRTLCYSVALCIITGDTNTPFIMLTWQRGFAN